MVKTFAAAGLQVLRCSYCNSLLLPVAAAKFRRRGRCCAFPPSGVEPVAGWLDGLLYSALAAEAEWLGRGHDLPAGQSLILIAQRNG